MSRIHKRIVRAGGFRDLCCFFAFGQTADQHSSPTTIFAPVSAPAVLAVAAAMFVVVFSLLGNAVVRFRKKTHDEQEPPQVYGSNQVELAWTVIPVLIVVALFMTRALGGGWQQ